MNKSLVTRLLFAAAFVLLAAVNSLVLSRVVDNQSQTPVARLWLSEREVPNVKWLALENSGVDLRIHWRNLGREGNTVDDHSPSWLSGKKLEELGFVFANGLPLGDRRAKPVLDREVFFVLEFSGPAYREAIRRAERTLAAVEAEQRQNPGDKSGSSNRFQAKQRIRAEERERSRLFVIDAGQDAAQLHKLYSDAGRYIITRGIVDVHYQKENGRLWARGTIGGLQPAKLHLPLKQRQQLDRILHEHHRDSVESKLPRYEAEVVYGSQYEPWIESIRALQVAQTEEKKE
ncbi:MAG: DUF4824 family protein [Desulfobulbus sp.]|nr:DUF4824 family protein [Desulfobulbus sp.]